MRGMIAARELGKIHTKYKSITDIHAQWSQLFGNQMHSGCFQQTSVNQSQSYRLTQANYLETRCTQVVFSKHQQINHRHTCSLKPTIWKPDALRLFSANVIFCQFYPYHHVKKLCWLHRSVSDFHIFLHTLKHSKAETSR